MIFLCPSLPRSFTRSHSIFHFLPDSPPSCPLTHFSFVRYPDPGSVPSYLGTFSGGSYCPATTHLVSTPREQRDLGRLARRSCWVWAWESGSGVSEPVGKPSPYCPHQRGLSPAVLGGCLELALQTEEYSDFTTTHASIVQTSSQQPV